MTRVSMASHLVRGLLFVALIAVVGLQPEVGAANKNQTPSKKPIKNPKFDPTAEQVELFDAVDAGHVTVRLIPKDAMSGTVLIENKTDKTLTVKIPEAVVGISIHAQAGNLGFGNFLGANNGGQGNLPGMAGGQQAAGGGIGMNQQNGPNNQLFGPQNGFPNPGGGLPNQAGNNFFSVPAEKVISLPFNSVCLEHGKQEPNSSSKYTLIPVSKVSTDPVLYHLLAAVGTGKVDAQAAQAAAWHLANKLSFEQLADKTNAPLPGLAGAPYFTREQLQTAKDLIKQATEKAAETATAPAEKKSPSPVTTARSNGANTN